MSAQDDVIRYPYVCTKKAGQPQIILMARIEVFDTSEAWSDEMHLTIRKCSPVVERDSFRLANLV